ncbi:MAG: hypothetical protein M1609_10365, partial [Firmicutes bacterium]|nr:hypothetical protein [Bacillota bacterium]
MKLNGERLFNLAVLAVLCGFVFMAIDFTPKARLLPLVIGIPSLVLMIILVAADFLKNREPVK